MTDPNGWIFMRYVNERSQVRKKMLYSSTSNPLKEALGLSSFQWSFTGVDKDNMSIDNFVSANATLLTPGAREALKPILDARDSEVTAEERYHQEQFRRQQEYEILTREEQLKHEEAHLEVHSGGTQSLSYPVDDQLADQLARFVAGEFTFVELVCSFIFLFLLLYFFISISIYLFFIFSLSHLSLSRTRN